MQNILQKGLQATRESKRIEFKLAFDPNSACDWCEIVKDLVAIANSGGGVIIFGLDDKGTPAGTDIRSIASVDPADIGNKVSRYTGPIDLEFEIQELEKNSNKLCAFIIEPATSPIIFEKPGTYAVEGGRQKSAFGMGTMYFRHGAKSEPGTSADVRGALDRRVESLRRTWMKGVRTVVRAPRGSEIVAVTRPQDGSSLSFPTTVRAVKDTSAIPVLLTRDATKAKAVFMHERLSDGIFDEINNVVEANRLLARDQPKFVLGSTIYYRIYAERQYVSEEYQLLLLASGVDLYAPALFWLNKLPDRVVARSLVDLYLQPRTPQIHFFVRTALVLGSEFSEFVAARFRDKWQHYSQPPSFYFAVKDAADHAKRGDHRVLAARVGINSQIQIPGCLVVGVHTLLGDPTQAAQLLSKACLQVFRGESSLRSEARSLDYIAYGAQLRERSPGITKAFIKAIGEKHPGDEADDLKQD